MKKNKHYYEGNLIVKSKTIYKYALLYRKEDGKLVKVNVGNNRELLLKKFIYYTKGFGRPFEGSHLYTDQFHDPSRLYLVELQVNA